MLRPQFDGAVALSSEASSVVNRVVELLMMLPWPMLPTVPAALISYM